MATRGEGKTIRWLRAHADYRDADWCLIWPFSTIRGYGRFGYLGQGYYAHTFMCELAHGRAQDPTHQAAHSCGNSRCVNPLHLSWKTPSENQMDKFVHGTAHQLPGKKRSKILASDVERIRALAGQKTHDEIAAMFGVCRRTIGALLSGKTWGADRKQVVFQPEEDARIRELNDRGHSLMEISRIMGRPGPSVWRRARRMGLKINFPKPERKNA